MKILNFKKIFGIIITSSILGLAINYFNPAGIPLISEKLELKWAPDSLFLESNQDSIVAVETPSKYVTTENDEIPSNVNEKLKVDSKEQSKPVQTVSEKTDKKEIKKENEVKAFSEPKAIKLVQAFTLFNNGTLFIDARDESDFLAGHISNSINIPFDDFENHDKKLEEISKEKPLVIYCAGTDCDLSILLGNLLYEQGYKQVYIFFGGWIEWSEANYPVEYPSE